MLEKKRCAWVTSDPLYIEYHDTEWGRAIDDDRLLFEFLNLEGMQAGLSWLTILKKREQYRHRFQQFDAKKIIQFTPEDIEACLQDPGIIRNRLKVNAIMTNAQAYLNLKEKTGSFSDYLWQFVDGKPIQNHWKTRQDVPTHTPISDQLAKDLKERGFKFIGTTICYAFMQAVGMVNDHTIHCYCYSEIKKGS